MYSVLLVDDERTLREGMRTFIPWNELGFRVTAEADNGAKALELIVRGGVDVVFLDIHMPRVSGLDLLQEMDSRGVNAAVVILSGYNNFEYVRAALKFRAVEYLLKPIDMDEVVPLLRRIFTQLEERERGLREQDKMMRQVLESELIRLLAGVGDPTGQAEIWDKLGEHYRDTEVHIAAVAFSGDSEPADGGSRLSAAIEDRISRLAGARATVMLNRKNGERFVLLLAIRQQLAQQALLDCYGALLGEFAETDAVLLARPLPFARLMADFRQAVEAGVFKRRLFYSSNRLVSAEIGQAEAAATAFAISVEECRAVIEWMRASDRQRVNQWLSGLYFRLRSNPHYEPDSVRAAYAQLLHTALQEGVAPADGAAPEQLAERLRGVHTLSRLHRLAARLLEEAIARSEQRNRDKKRRIVNEIKRYVSEHLAEPILLSDLAGKFALSSEYLSTLFKREEGVNFNHYLKVIRVRKAMELIEADCNVKIYELAYRVGYTDQRHFSKVFREVTGLTPKEFVEKL